ncbi:MAG: carboxypeptidase regulatory-like domain-containing protein [Phycisphaerae bacterium]|nr:carboxypeptidase regulatory-like domain-containing protein [Phycisphaerae bacterium]
MRHSTINARPFPCLVLPALLVALAWLVACSKPIPFQLSDTDHGAALEGVRIHRHSVWIFSPLPTRSDPVETDFSGVATVPIPPRQTCLTFLRQGYEPASVAVFRTVPAAIAEAPGECADDTTDAAWQRILCWDDLMPKIPVPVRMRPLRSEEVEVFVVDESGAPLSDCEVLGATFLYLPAPGVEPEWGLPSLQRTRTDSRGRATVRSWSGFRNRITARSPDRGEAWQDLDGAQRTSVHLAVTPLLRRTQRFKIVDDKGRPVAGATIAYGEIRNGLPASPNAFVVETDRNGETPVVSLPNANPLLLQVTAKGHKDRTTAPLWRALEEGGTSRVVVERK